MYNCEIFSVQSNHLQIHTGFDEDAIAKVLSKYAINVVYQTTIKADAQKITQALYSSEQTQLSPKYSIFVNALDSAEPAQFKNLFYDFIKSNEERITPNEENKDRIAKVKVYNLGDLGNGYNGYCFQIFDKHYIVLPQCSLTGNDITTLLDKAVSKANESFLKNSTDFPDGLTFIERPKKKKEGFIKSFIPQKDDPKNVKRRKWIVLIAILIFLIAAAYLINELIIQPWLNSRITSDIHDIAYSNSDGDDSNKGPAQDWDALKKINKEIVGWITLKDTIIDYPVLEHKGDNENSQYYLNHTYKKSYSVYGSIFVDYRSTKSVKSKNVILHGHNMTDGSMFHELVNYGDLTGNLEYYKKHPIIDFNTPEADAKYKIISVFKTNTLYDHGYFFNYMQGEFLSDAEFMNFVYNCRVRSLINCPVMVNEDDQILTLSTCSYEYSNWRTVVVARKLREGEKAKVNTEIATLNSNPLFPDIYYTNHAGSRPTEMTFKTAEASGLINWYDGEGNLEGSETLTASVEANPTEPPTEKPDKKNKKKNSSSAPAITTYYEVKFVNWDGSEYYTLSVREGDSVSPPDGTPGLPSDNNYNYIFTGWDTAGLDLNNVQYSMTIYPNFKYTPK
ncbi:MAG: class B sortase [Ruminococcus sp.]|nr:class B sortase [Ruminococcus sp.]